MHLKTPQISKFSWGSMPPDSPRYSVGYAPVGAVIDKHPQTDLHIICAYRC